MRHTLFAIPTRALFLVALFSGLLVLTSCGSGGGYTPLDPPADHDMELDMQDAADEPDYWPDPGGDYDPSEDPDLMPFDEGHEFTDDELESASECPRGCTTHIRGCDIKGNISVDSGERIYHVPGQKYYNSTVINPAFGERWFCTEADAVSNGWRKSAK